MNKLSIGDYIEQLVDWLSTIGTPFFHQITRVIDSSVNFLQDGLLILSPWATIAILTLLAFLVKNRGLKWSKISRRDIKSALSIPLLTLGGLAFINLLGYWEETMTTFVLVIVSTIIILLMGIPLGIWCARSSWLYSIIRPILDFMQTMPAFVYLIPAILFFSVGNVPGVFATVIFSLPPAVRMTALGIMNVPKEIVEASMAFGCTSRQVLLKVQIPLALNTILAGVNQVIMLALSMVVIASMVGASGLGESVYAGIQQANIALGFEAGLCIVILAIILDRITQAIGKRS